MNEIYSIVTLNMYVKITRMSIINNKQINMFSPIRIFSILNLYNLCFSGTDEAVMLYTIERATLVGFGKTQKLEVFVNWQESFYI